MHSFNRNRCLCCGWHIFVRRSGRVHDPHAPCPMQALWLFPERLAGRERAKRPRTAGGTYETPTVFLLGRFCEQIFWRESISQKCRLWCYIICVTTLNFWVARDRFVLDQTSYTEGICCIFRVATWMIHCLDHDLDWIMEVDDYGMNHLWIFKLWNEWNDSSMVQVPWPGFQKFLWMLCWFEYEFIWWNRRCAHSINSLLYQIYHISDNTYKIVASTVWVKSCLTP